MKNRLYPLIIAFLVLTVALSGCVAASVMVRLESCPHGLAVWVLDQVHSGTYAVKLYIPEATDAEHYAEVSVPVDKRNLRLGDLDLDEIYFWCKVDEGAWTPYFIFELDCDLEPDDALDRINTDGFSSAGYDDWATYVAADSPEWQWPDGSWNSWADTVTHFGADTRVLRIYVELSGPFVSDGAILAYVDDIAIMGWLYYLEYPGIIFLNVPA